MIEDEATYVRDSFALIDAFAGEASMARLETALAAHLARFGATHFALSRLPPPGQDAMAPIVMIDRWPAGWLRRYDEERYVRHDPVMARLVSSLEPFVWSDIVVDRRAEPTAYRIMDEAAAIGLADGFTVPVFDPSGAQGCITCAGERLDLRKRVRDAVYMTCLFGYAAAERIRSASAQADIEPLSGREREVLRWIAVGRSQDEVATILGISERTVEAHLRNARSKLRARNTVQAAVVAMQRREIRL